jgi:leucyl aminopeptidase
MIPRKATDEIGPYADKKGIPKAHMDAIVTGYYRELRVVCSELKHPRVVIRGLGTLRTSHNKLKKGITRLLKWMKANKSKNQFSVYKNNNANLQRIKTVVEKMEHMWSEEREFRDIRKQNKQQK